MKLIDALNHCKGWTLYEADFKRQAAGTSKTGTVLLTRNAEQARAYYTLSPMQQESYPLFVSGQGHTLPEALVNAVLVALELPAVPVLEAA